MVPSVGQEGQIATGHTEMSAICRTLLRTSAGHDLRVQTMNLAS